MIVPKAKHVVAIEGDNSRKKVLVKEISEELKKYCSDNGYAITDETMEIGYDNLSMSK